MSTCLVASLRKWLKDHDLAEIAFFTKFLDDHFTTLYFRDRCLVLDPGNGRGCRRKIR